MGEGADFCGVWGRVSSMYSCWPQACYVIGGWPCSLVFLPTPFQCQNYRSATPHPVYAGLQIKPQAFTCTNQSSILLTPQPFCIFLVSKGSVRIYSSITFIYPTFCFKSFTKFSSYRTRNTDLFWLSFRGVSLCSRGCVVSGPCICKTHHQGWIMQ